jgi:hypothetical protein
MSTPNPPSPTAELFDLRRRSLEERVEGIEDRLAELKHLPGEVKRAVVEHKDAAQRRAARPKEGS